MKVRTFLDSDIQIIDEIWKNYHQQDFSVPDRKTVVTERVVENDAGQVIAYGQVKLFAEAMMILDLSVSKKERIQAIILLMHEAFRGSKGAGLNNIYAFIQDPDFALLIEKHFDFERVDYPGELLLRRL